MAANSPPSPVPGLWLFCSCSGQAAPRPQAGHGAQMATPGSSPYSYSDWARMWPQSGQPQSFREVPAQRQGRSSWLSAPLTGRPELPGPPAGPSAPSSLESVPGAKAFPVCPSSPKHVLSPAPQRPHTPAPVGRCVLPPVPRSHAVPPRAKQRPLWAAGLCAECMVPLSDRAWQAPGGCPPRPVCLSPDRAG